MNTPQARGPTPLPRRARGADPRLALLALGAAWTLAGCDASNVAVRTPIASVGVQNGWRGTNVDVRSILGNVSVNTTRRPPAPPPIFAGGGYPPPYRGPFAPGTSVPNVPFSPTSSGIGGPFAPTGSGAAGPFAPAGSGLPTAGGGLPSGSFPGGSGLPTTLSPYVQTPGALSPVVVRRVIQQVGEPGEARVAAQALGLDPGSAEVQQVLQQLEASATEVAGSGVPGAAGSDPGAQQQAPDFEGFMP